MEEMFVTPEMYGAVADGITDDSIALRDAVNSGKPVLLTGTYYINGLEYPEAKTGVKGIIFNPGARVFAASGEIISNNAVYLVFQSNSSVKGITGKGISFDFTGTNIICENCVSIESYVTGFNIETRISTPATNIKFVNCIAKKTTGHGFLINVAFYNESRRNAVVDNIIYERCFATECGNNIESGWITGFCIHCAASDVREINFIDCVADNAIESGFHSEYAVNPKRLNFTRCISMYNGTRKIQAEYGNGFLMGGHDLIVNFRQCVSAHNANIRSLNFGTSVDNFPDITNCKFDLENIKEDKTFNYSDSICVNSGEVLYNSNIDKLTPYSNRNLHTTMPYYLLYQEGETSYIIEDNVIKFNEKTLGFYRYFTKLIQLPLEDVGSLKVECDILQHGETETGNFYVLLYNNRRQRLAVSKPIAIKGEIIKYTYNHQTINVDEVEFVVSDETKNIQEIEDVCFMVVGLYNFENMWIRNIVVSKITN